MGYTHVQYLFQGIYLPIYNSALHNSKLCKAASTLLLLF